MQEKNLEYLVTLIKSTAQEISRRLGYNGGKPNQGAA